MSAITVRKSFQSYNSRRYGKPWGAQVVLKNGNPDYDFSVGNYWGTDNGGDVVLNVPVGSIVAFGQRNNRNTKYTQNDWYLVGEEGEMASVTRSEASEILMNPVEEEPVASVTITFPGDEVEYLTSFLKDQLSTSITLQEGERALLSSIIEKLI